MHVVVVGCGSIATTHVRCIRLGAPGASITLVDRDPAVARQLGEKLGVQDTASSLEQVFSHCVPDAVHILTPLDSHVAIATQALSVGCHVYVEKPIVPSRADLQQLYDLADTKGRHVAVGLSALGMPVIQRAHDIIRSGGMGRLISAHCDFLCAWPGNSIPYANPAHWAYRMRGGVLRNMADHPLSVVAGAMDTVDAQSCVIKRRNILPHDNADLMHVVLENRDQVGSFTLSLAHRNATRSVQYFLEGGTISVDMGRQLFAVTRRKGPENAIQKVSTGFTSGLSMVTGTASNLFNAAIGKLARDPGIHGLVLNFYATIRGEASLCVERERALAILGVQDRLWGSDSDIARTEA